MRKAPIVLAVLALAAAAFATDYVNVDLGAQIVSGSPPNTLSLLARPERR